VSDSSTIKIMGRIPENLGPIPRLPTTASGLSIAPADVWLPAPEVHLNGAGRLVRPGTEVRKTTSGLLVVGGIPETETRRAPSHRLVLLTDFSSAKGAKRDDRSPNEVLIEYERILEQNGVRNLGPLRQDNGIYALRPVSGAYLNDLYGRRYESSDIPRVHVVVCDPGVGGDREGIVVKTNKATYVGPNNGVFWEAIKREGIAVGRDGEPEVYKVHDWKFNEVRSATFHGREVFAPIAAEISSGKDPSRITEWLEKFDPEALVKLDFQPNQVLEVDGFNLIKLNAKMPDDNPLYAQITVTDRLTQETKKLTIPTAEKFVDTEPGALMIYPGSDNDLLEIAASMAVHDYENNAVKQVSITPQRPIEPGDILKLEWVYGGDLEEAREVVLSGAEGR
jgi:S-adenosylmethionine hydrolase